MTVDVSSGHSGPPTFLGCAVTTTTSGPASWTFSRPSAKPAACRWRNVRITSSRLWQSQSPASNQRHSTSGAKIASSSSKSPRRQASNPCCATVRFELLLITLLARVPSRRRGFLWGIFVASILVAHQQRQEMLLQPVGVVDDVAAGREQPRRFSLPACVCGECEVGVPDDVPRPAEAAERAVREPLAGESGSVPEADDAGIVEDVRVPGAARVTGEHGQPDRVDGELGVWMSVQDVCADPTGPDLADASGRRGEQD